MRRQFIGAIVFLFWAPLLWAQQSSSSSTDLVREEAEDHYFKWLNEDVAYIVSPEEEAVFKKLTTPEEKDQFIEQFWARRDPDPATATNEYKEEHYRRIAYANEHFRSGFPGWMTDRGRVYIIHGKPAEIESHPAGGHYNRQLNEGGGATATYPFEVWRYREIDGVGQDVELEFVDPTMTGEYRLALNPGEKDALLNVPGAGLTLAEAFGLVDQRQRPFLAAGNHDQYPFMYQRAADTPFARYSAFRDVQRPVSIKYQDLKEIVSVNVGYDTVPVTLREDYFRLDESQVLVPVTVIIPNRNLSFKPEGSWHSARIRIYGIITSINNRVIKEFEDDLVARFPSSEREFAIHKFSIYQKVIPLDARTRYRLDLVVKDGQSGAVGLARGAIAPPQFPTEELCASSFVLADSILPIKDGTDPAEMFVIGDVKVRPNVTREFTSNRPLGLYFHVYNALFDQSTFEPSLRVIYQLYKDGEMVHESIDESGQSIQFLSSQRIVLSRALSLQDFQAGDYQVRIEVEDRLRGEKVEVSDQFKIVTSKTG